MNNMGIFFKNNIMVLLRNRLRIALTIFGCSIGLLVFIIGNACMEGYFYNLYRDAYLFCNNVVLLFDGSDDTYDVLENAIKPNYSTSIYSSGDTFFVSSNKYYYNGVKVENNISYIGVNQNDFSNIILSKHNDQYFCTKSKLIYGRGITDADIQNKNHVAVVEKNTAQLLFQTDNCVGETIEVHCYYGYIELEIVGVIDTLGIHDADVLTVKKQLSQTDNKDISLYHYVYIPNTLVQEYMKDDVKEIRVLVYDENNYKEAVSGFTMIMREMDLSTGIVSRKSMLQEADEVKWNLKTTFNIIIILIITFSGLLLVTIFVFSVKERVYEIGIRRAIGASKFDILMQFMLEGMLIAVISAFFASIAGIIVCNFANTVILRFFCIKFSLGISLRLLFATFGIAALQGILFSVVPAIVAARVDPTETIRWE